MISETEKKYCFQNQIAGPSLVLRKTKKRKVDCLFERGGTSLRAEERLSHASWSGTLEENEKDGENGSPHPCAWMAFFLRRAFPGAPLCSFSLVDETSTPGCKYALCLAGSGEGGKECFLVKLSGNEPALFRSFLQYEKEEEARRITEDFKRQSYSQVHERIHQENSQRQSLWRMDNFSRDARIFFLGGRVAVISRGERIDFYDGESLALETTRIFSAIPHRVVKVLQDGETLLLLMDDFRLQRRDKNFALMMETRDVPPHDDVVSAGDPSGLALDEMANIWVWGPWNYCLTVLAPDFTIIFTRTFCFSSPYPEEMKGGWTLRRGRRQKSPGVFFHVMVGENKLRYYRAALKW